MKIQLKALDKSDWHKWYAWYPVKTCCNKLVWLDYVKRKEFVAKGVYYMYKL